MCMHSSVNKISALHFIPPTVAVVSANGMYSTALDVPLYAVMFLSACFIWSWRGMHHQLGMNDDSQGQQNSLSPDDGGGGARTLHPINKHIFTTSTALDIFLRCSAQHNSGHRAHTPVRSSGSSSSQNYRMGDIICPA